MRSLLGWWKETTDVVMLNSPWMSRRTGLTVRCVTIFLSIVQWCVYWNEFQRRAARFLFLPYGSFLLMWSFLAASLWSMFTKNPESVRGSMALFLGLNLSTWLLAVLTMGNFLPGQFLDIFIILCHSNVHPIALLFHVISAAFSCSNVVPVSGFHSDFNVVEWLYGQFAQCILLCAFTWDFTARIQALTELGPRTRTPRVGAPSRVSASSRAAALEHPLAGRSAWRLSWASGVNQWIWWAVMLAVKQWHAQDPLYRRISENRVFTWTCAAPCVLVFCCLVAGREQCTAVEGEVALAVVCFLPPTLLGVEMTLALAETGSHGFLFGLLMETFISIFTAANLLAMQTAVSAGCRPIISAAGGLVATCTSLALWQWYPAAISIRLALLWVVLLSHITDYRQRLWDMDRLGFADFQGSPTHRGIEMTNRT